MPNNFILKTKQMTKEQVTELNCKKHVKIYKLKQLGLSNKEIAEALTTNVGHVYKALKKYDEKVSDIIEFYQPLFNLMSEHNLILLEGEMDEIISVVVEMLNTKNINNKATT